MLDRLPEDKKSIALNLCGSLRPIKGAVPNVVYDHAIDLYCFVNEQACTESENGFFFENEDSPKFQEEVRTGRTAYLSCLKRAVRYLKENPNIGEGRSLDSPCALENLQLSFAVWYLDNRIRTSNHTKGKVRVVEFSRKKAEAAFKEAKEAQNVCLERQAG